MKTQKIKITKEEMQKAKENKNIDFLYELYELPGMHGGLDHVEFNENSIEVFDRGMNNGNTVLDNSFILIYDHENKQH